MIIEKLKVSEIIPYINNAKEHPQEQINQIKSSILEFGFNDPIAIDENNVIIEGHGRLLAIQELGYKDVDCIRLTHLSEAKKKAYILAHNKLTMNSGLDLELLTLELENLKELDIDMSEFGFEIITMDEFDEDFELASGDKEPFQQMTFTFADAQADEIRSAIENIKKTDEYKYIETYGNENSNGNAIYCLIEKVYNNGES